LSNLVNLTQIRRAGGRATAALALGALSLLWAAPGSAGAPAGYTEYLIPFDEDVFVYVTDPLAFDAIPANRPTSAIISVTTWADATAIYVDHWENGYGFDSSDPDATADEKYLGNLGETLSFVSDPIPRPRTGADGNTYVGAAGNCNAQAPPKTPVFRNTTVYCYDGRDYIYAAGGATTMTRGGWIQGSGGNTLGPRAAIGEEVYPLAPQLIRYVLPFGEGAGGSSYERVIAVIQAVEDDTVLRIDFNGDGTFDAFNTENGYRTPRVNPVDATSLTLQKGHTYILDRDSDGVGGLLAKDAIILGSKTLQVEYFYGEDDGSYDTRAVAAYPRGFWGRNYYAVVDGAPGGADTDILIYNPDLSSTITITWRTTVGNGTFTLAPQESAFFEAKTGNYVPDGSAVYMSGTGTFWGISDIDVNSSAYDWGYSLVPDYLLEDEQTVAYAPGNIQNDDPLDFPPCNSAEGRADGLFVTPAFDNTTFFIDKNGDNLPDVDASIEVLRGVTPIAATGSNGYVANRLDTLYITGSNVGTTAGSDCDLTGARVWATGPFTMAYGQNPQKATPAGGLDLGYTVLPNPGDWMELALTVDKSTSPVVLSTTAGATATFTLVIGSHLFDIDGVSVVDTLPANWEYVSGSTTITRPDLTQISGGAADPSVSLPTLTWGAGLLGDMLPNQTVTITFQARTTAAFAVGALTRNLAQATGTRTVGGVTQTFNARDFVFNTYQNTTVSLGITKTSSVPEPTPVSPGDTLTYTVTVSNPGSSSAPLTNVWINDVIPNGTSYVPGSGQIAGCFDSDNVRDEFGAVSYSNDDGSQNWSGPWSETDTLGGGPSGGAVRVTSGALRFTTTPGTVFVLDAFNANGYAFGNNGSVDWANGWTETGDDGSLGGGDLEIAGNRLEFQGGADANDAFQRSVTITGATTATLSFDFEDAASNISGFDDAVVEYSIDGGGYTTLFTMNQGDPHTNYSSTFAVSGTTLDVRFRLLDDIEGGDFNAFDNVQVIHNGVGGGGARDEFNTAGSATGNNGTVNWASNWVDNEDGNLGGGDIEIEQGRLEFQDSTDGGESVQRTADAAGATSITVSYDWTDAGVDDGEGVTAQWSTDGTTWNNLRTFDGGSTASGAYIDNVAWSPGNTTFYLRLLAFGNYDGNEEAWFDNVQVIANAPSGGGGGPAANDRAARTVNLSTATSAILTFSSATSGTLDPGDVVQVWIDDDATFGGDSVLLQSVADDGAFTGSYDISAYMSAATTVFFVTASGIDASDEWRSFDNVDISYTTTLSFPSDDPPGFLSSAAACSVAPNGAVTLTFSVTVDDPFPTGQTEIVNTATAAATEIPIPQSASARNIVIVPTAASGTVGDRVWLDADGDGVFDPGEGGLAGVQVTLRDVWGTPLQVATTDSQGRYLFTDVAPGNGYFVEITGGLPGGLVQTTDGRTDLRTNDFDLADGQDYDLADLGFQAIPGTAAIGDLVWVDADQDQTRDPGEVGLAGVTVALYADTNGDGAGDGPPIATTVTGPGGTYLFTGIPADGVLDYAVFVDPAQAVLTGFTPTTLTNFPYANLPSGATRVDADAGFVGAPGTTFTISDGVWFDDGSGGGTAGNGVRDGSEPGIAGVTVALLNAGGFTIATTTSDAAGNFSFTGVPANQNYRWVITDDDAVLADYYGTTSFAQSGQFQMVGSLTGNLDYTPSPHFGYAATRSIGDTVWNDLDGDGVQDPGEPGIGSVTVLLYQGDGDALFEPGGGDGTPVASLVTSPSGIYLFSGLTDGEYWVHVDPTQPALLGLALTTAARDDDPVAAGHQDRVLLAGGASQLGVDFGYQAGVGFELSGRLWDDVNADGADGGETGFGNVTLELVSGGAVIGTTVSAPDGSFSFDGLAPGTYTVRFTDVNGVLSGFQTTFERTEGALAGGYDGQETATIVASSITDVNFGFYNPFRITLAIVTSFTAHDESGSVVIQWETSAEIGTIGFELFRFDPQAERYVRQNDELLPALIGNRQGGIYRFVDEGARVGETYWYLLVEIEASGRRNHMGPYRVDTDLTLYAGGSAQRREALGARLSRRFANTARVKPSPRSVIGLQAEATRALGRPKRWEPREQVKVGVSRSGVYFVPLAEVAAAGIPGPDPKRLALAHHGQGVAFTSSADGAGLYFYAQAFDSPYTEEDVYWLSAANQSRMMRFRRDRGAVPGGGETFTRSVRAEQDLLPSPHLFTDPAADWSLWDFAFAGMGSKSFSFRADGASGSGTASLTLRLHGGNDTPADPDHHARIRLNGQVVGEVYWDGIHSSETTHGFDASLLVDGENTLALEALTDTGAAYSLVYLDSFAVEYQSRYRAFGGELECSSGENASILISGFATGEIMVFDVTSPEQPVVVDGEVLSLADGSFGVALSPPAPHTVYHALSADALRAGRIVPDQPSELRKRKNSAEYVIVTTAELVETARTLADHRNLSSMVVDVEDVYDEFNFGVVSPQALRSFLAHAWKTWQVPPAYVVLAGDGSWDYKDRYGFGGNLLPPAMVGTPHGLATSDAWFADVDPSDPVPEIAIGRLPVASPAELGQVIAKIQARESLGGAWLRRLLAVADNPDAVGAYTADSDRLASLAPADFGVEKVYLPTVTPAQARTRIVAAINAGTGMASYVGHAGYDVLADEGMMRIAQVNLLTNADRPTVFTAMTCVAGDFALPFIDPIGELLVRKPGGGAAAVWAPTSMSDNIHAVALAEEYYARVFGGQPMRIGDAILGALQAYHDARRPEYLLGIYGLLGDPAMPLE
jgi:uncharacterized repeat protein (TIGR01451 family)